MSSSDENWAHAQTTRRATKTDVSSTPASRRPRRFVLVWIGLQPEEIPLAGAYDPTSQATFLFLTVAAIGMLGGLIASLLDCHGTGTAAAAAYRAEGRPLGSEPALRFVTASLKVDYLKPTPLGNELEIRARVRESSERKAVVEVDVLAKGTVTVRGEVVAVRMPASMRR